MASPLTTLLSLSLLSLLLSPSLSSIFPRPFNLGNVCNTAPDPNFCRSVLPPGVTDPIRLGRFSFATSLSKSVAFSDTLNQYLASHRPSLSLPALRALQDCQVLSDLSTDFLSTTSSTLNSTTTTLPDTKADDSHTLLSAVLTNQQTCSDGLQSIKSASPALNYLSPFLSNGTKFFGVSLHLFVNTWRNGRVIGPPRVGRRLLGIGRNGQLPLKMSDPDRNLFEIRSGRKLLQSASSVQVAATVVVSQDGTGNFTTIGDAVAAAPNVNDNSDGYFLIYVDAGVYEEYVGVTKKKRYIMMIGAGINQTIVTGNHSNGDGWTTFGSATFAVVGEGFVGINMTVRNTAGAINHQAVALRNGADLSTFYGCSFEGYQDTLYAHSLRQFYKDCDIYGTVDYIFGNAAVVFQNCNIYSRLPLSGQQNTVTAQGRIDPLQNTGISIQDSSILAGPDLAASDGSTNSYLGRPWKNYSLTVIMESFIDDVIDPAGWLPWDGDFALDTLYYAEYANTGPGSDTSQRVTWSGYHSSISSSDAINFTVGNFILGDQWLPDTAVPYQSGLDS